MQLSKREYFLLALNAGSFRWKRWVLSVFSMTRQPESAGEGIPLFLHTDPETGMYYFYNEAQERVTLSDAKPGEPALRFLEALPLKAGEIGNLKTDIVSTYGNALFNVSTLVYAFGDKIPYQEGQVSAKGIEILVERQLVDDPEPGVTLPANAIPVSEYKRFCEAMFALAGYTQLCVPSATPRTMTTDPRLAVRRAELLEKHKHEMHDLVVQSMIDAELIKIDKEWTAGDDAQGFYYKSKSFDVVRKKMFIYQGSENGFNVQGDFIPQSLEEGWDPKYLPAMANSLREGSYNRGALTALGGVAAKYNNRVFQNTRITEPDCGSPYGLSVIITDENHRYFLTNYVARPTSAAVELTEDNIKSYIGKTIKLRSPVYCRTEGANFCATCMGGALAEAPDAIGAMAGSIGSTFMQTMLSSMHGKSLSTAKFDLDQHLT